MKFDQILEQNIAAASLRLNFEIEKSTLNAMRSLGLDANYDCSSVDLAKKRMLDESPLYIKTIQLHGQMCADMYDDHPGYAYFYTESFESFRAPAYCSLTKAMQISLQMLTKAQQEVENEDECDGLFTPSSIILLDQFGNTVQEYSERYLGKGVNQTGWLEELPTESEFGALEQSARELDSEGSEEARWDNFDTARGLRAQASSLRRKIAIAKAIARVIH